MTTGTTGRRRARRGRALGPLMRVIAEFNNEYGVPCERLLCGHVIHMKHDICGRAVRRRCKHCRDEATAPGKEAP